MTDGLLDTNGAGGALVAVGAPDGMTTSTTVVSKRLDTQLDEFASNIDMPQQGECSSSLLSEMEKFS